MKGTLHADYRDKQNIEYCHASIDVIGTENVGGVAGLKDAGDMYQCSANGSAADASAP